MLFELLLVIVMVPNVLVLALVLRFLHGCMVPPAIKTRGLKDAGLWWRKLSQGSRVVVAAPSCHSRAASHASPPPRQHALEEAKQA